jgi:hypothetical protein
MIGNGHMNRPSQHQVALMFGEFARKPINPECLVTTVKHGGRSVKILTATSWYSAGSKLL